MLGCGGWGFVVFMPEVETVVVRLRCYSRFLGVRGWMLVWWAARNQLLGYAADVQSA